MILYSIYSIFKLAVIYRNHSQSKSYCIIEICCYIRSRPDLLKPELLKLNSTKIIGMNKCIYSVKIIIRESVIILNYKTIAQTNELIYKRKFYTTTVQV